MMNVPLAIPYGISVVIPSFNVHESIEDLLFRMQNSGQGNEFNVVDDFSTDGMRDGLQKGCQQRLDPGLRLRGIPDGRRIR